MNGKLKMTPLMVAIQRGHEEMTEFIIEKNTTADSQLNLDLQVLAARA